MDKGIALLSGGIDSPVAIHLLQDRLDIIAVHFHQQPLTGPEELEKVKTLVKILGVKKTYLIPFVDVLKEIVNVCGHKNYFVLSKILMLQTASRVAEREHAQYLITGENLGQVSSQTLSNLTVITQNVAMEIFRPVLTFDKNEIVAVAQKIGTYEVSKGPEICNLLGPKHPATKSNPEEIRKELGTLNRTTLLEECLKKAEVLES